MPSLFAMKAVQNSVPSLSTDDGGGTFPEIVDVAMVDVELAAGDVEVAVEGIVDVDIEEVVDIAADDVAGDTVETDDVEDADNVVEATLVDVVSEEVTRVVVLAEM